MASRSGGKKECFQFRRNGTCRYGDRCSYSHGSLNTGPATSGRNQSSKGSSMNRNSGQPEQYGRPGPGEENLHTENIPMPSPKLNSPWGPQTVGNSTERDTIREIQRMLARSPSLNPAQIEYLLTVLHAQIGASSASVTQAIIKGLADEYGLQFVRRLVETHYDYIPQNLRQFGFWQHCVPFLKLISHEELKNSLVLENAVGTIYNVIYGHSASRAIPFFTQIACHLQQASQNSGNDQSKQQDISKGLAATAAALYMTVSINQSAMVQEEFRTIAEKLRDVYNAGDISQGTSQAATNNLDHERRVAYSELSKIQSKLNMGDTLALSSPDTPLASTITTSFEVEHDLPGELSKLGPRHDNDKASIRSIKILPTTNEILTNDSRNEYLPMRDTSSFDKGTVQHLTPGINRVIDAQFRLLREDNTGQLRDAVRLIFATWADRSRPPEQLRRGVTQAATIIHPKLCLHRFHFDQNIGLLVDVTFEQPRVVQKLADSHSRQIWWESSRYMKSGNLLCMVDQQEQCTFFVVESLYPQRARNTVDNLDDSATADEPPERAMVALRPIDPVSDIPNLIKRFAEQKGRNSNFQQFLVEFPELLFASFEPILKCLQSIMDTANVPFARWIAPTLDMLREIPASPDQKYVQLPPPLYMTAGNEITLDLNCLLEREFFHTGVQLRHSVRSPCSILDLQRYTTLDKGQCEALLAGLNRELALIQGPPGTGKSYVGVKLVKVLLDNREKLDLGPIICICYTNHALDQFLVELLHDGAKQLVRLGTRSKAPELENLTLHAIAASVEGTKHEKHAIWELREEIGSIADEMWNQHGILDQILLLGSWSSLKIYLEMNHPQIHQQFYSDDELDEDTFTLVQSGRRKNSQAINNWLNLRLLPPPPEIESKRSVRSVEALLKLTDMKALNREERVRLKQAWEWQIQEPLSNTLRNRMLRFERSRRGLKQHYSERDRRCLQRAHVIGVTTTGLANHAEMLRSLKAKVLVCEEAGEVLEAHMLTALLPSLQHAILIGDHEQLRPHISNYSLSMESTVGQNYRLDESLFERLAREQYRDLVFPLAALDTQRRMHPSISALVRETLYEGLIDHANVKNYPPVMGLAQRMFWLDHNYLEAGAENADPMSTSKSNLYEEKMVAALVKHLFRQGHYKSNEIAVLTPYLGQMMRLRDRLGRMFEVLISDKDQEQLDIEELKEGTPVAAAEKPGERSSDLVKRGTLLKELRLATVDNFQGEEADIIVISLVRSNPQQNCGFLKTSNRINVLLSRARHGMYIIGNANTARSVPMWADILSILKRGDNIGDSLQLCCPRHPYKNIWVKDDEDFLTYAPEGGCEERCGLRLPDCGHTCITKCHSDILHQAEICNEPCTRTLPGCNHPCVTPCGLTCEECVVVIPTVPLPCGHISHDIPCHKAQKPGSIECHEIVKKILPHCGHEVSANCYVDVADFLCVRECGEPLACGHICKAQCCKNRSSEHPTCRSECGRPFNTCSHSCRKVCHSGDGSSCGLCDSPCETACLHSTCNKKCHEACTPCAMPCKSGCPHRGKCNMPCAVPCDVLPCSKRCTLRFDSCGHQCSGICGEICPPPKFCQVCALDSIKDEVVDMIMMERYRDIDVDGNPIIFLNCGHFFCMETLDGLMSLYLVYETDIQGNIVHPRPQAAWITNIQAAQARCPTCRGPVNNVNRYNTITKGIMIEETTKKFIANSMAQWLSLEGEVDGEVEKLEMTREDFIKEHEIVPALPANFPVLNNSVMRLKQRHQAIQILCHRIRMFRLSIGAEGEPYSKIHALVTDAIRRQKVMRTNFISENMTSQLRARLLALSLYLKTYWIYLLDLYRISTAKGVPGDEQMLIQQEHINPLLEGLKVECKTLGKEARATKQPQHEVKAIVFHALFVSLQLQMIDNTTKPLPTQSRFGVAVNKLSTSKEEPRRQELLKLDLADAICRQYPGSTRGLRKEISAARTSLRGTEFYSPVTSEEQREVFQAMAAEFGGSGTGHWYYCQNRHLFTIGECGRAMQLARCPQCDAPIGGQNHESIAGVTRAMDFEHSSIGSATAIELPDLMGQMGF